MDISKEHKNKFNKYPVIIGLFLDNPTDTASKILQAIKENKPYDEYELLSDDEKKAFDNGELLF